MRISSSSAAVAVTIAAASIAATGEVRAEVTISSAATQNVICSGGVCSPTDAEAVLNVNDLKALLANGNVQVTTSGTGVQANDLVIRNALSWTSANSLALDAYRQLAINGVISVEGNAGLSIDTNGGGAGGALTFGTNGRIKFSNLSSPLAIDGVSYTLVGNVKALASAIAARPDGDFAFAVDYDASKDGIYAASPVPTAFSGNFEGLGNRIRNLTINDSSSEYIGLFAQLDGGRIANIGVVNANLTATNSKGRYAVGALLGYNGGLVRESFSSGSVSAVSSSVGGLIGWNAVGSLLHGSHSSASLSLAKNGIGVTAAGLVGWNDGKVQNSYATGSVSTFGEGGAVAGLVSYNGGEISSSFATGAVSATGSGSHCSGLVSLNFKSNKTNNIGKIRNSYETGSVNCGGTGGQAGGFAFENSNIIEYSYSTGQVNSSEYDAGFVINQEGSMDSNYWDTTSSGIYRGVYDGSSSGLQGLTTQQLQSGLPAGFDPKIWAEDRKINNGLPYLIANPPPH